MRFLSDVCVHGMIVARLRDLGADVKAFPGKPGAPDTEVLAASVSDDRVLITSDKGFGDLVFVQKFPCYGAILVRMTVATVADADAVVALIMSLPDRGRGAFSTLDTNGVRRRLIT